MVIWVERGNFAHDTTFFGTESHNNTAFGPGPDDNVITDTITDTITDVATDTREHCVNKNKELGWLDSPSILRHSCKITQIYCAVKKVVNTPGANADNGGNASTNDCRITDRKGWRLPTEAEILQAYRRSARHRASWLGGHVDTITANQSVVQPPAHRIIMCTECLHPDVCALLASTGRESWAAVRDRDVSQP